MKNLAQRDTGAAAGGGETAEQKFAKQVNDAIDAKIKAHAETSAQKSELEALRESVKGLTSTSDFEALKKECEKLGLDMKAMKEETGNKGAKVISFSEAFQKGMAEAINTASSDYHKLKSDRNATFKMKLEGVTMKSVADMTTSNNLTGDAMATYNPNQALVPGHNVNFRDLIPTTQSPTGIYVTYRETGTEGSIGTQTEGSAKSQIDYDLTEVKASSGYIAGFARFSKQMLHVLPWIQGTLNRMLMRDFMKKENTSFNTTITSAATGDATTTKTVAVEQLVNYIATQRGANFNASFIIVSWADWMKLLLTMPGTEYSIPGGVSIDLAGNIRICGVPVIGASWATADKALVIDSDFLERVETESMNVAFGYEDADNFTKNLITARVECFEVLNPLRVDAHIFGSLAAS